jgi:hypothetical protein
VDRGIDSGHPTVAANGKRRECRELLAEVNHR